MRISQKKEFADLLKCLRDEEVHRLPEGEKCLAATQINTSKKLSRWKAWPAIIALILLCAGFLVMNPNVYAAVITWFKGGKVEEINQNGAFNSMFYYELPGTSDKTAEYRFTWIPERFDRKELLSKEDSRCDYGEEYSYMIHDESSPKDTCSKLGRVAVGYVYLTEETAKLFFTYESNNLLLLENERIEKGSFTGEYYYYKNKGFSSSDFYFDAFWVDSVSGVAFRLTGDISKEEAFRIIENVKRIK